MALEQQGMQPKTKERPGALVVALVLAIVFYLILQIGITHAVGIGLARNADWWSVARVLIEVVSVIGFAGGFALGLKMMHR